MEAKRDAQTEKMKEIFASFNEAWMKYWASYVSLQDRLYESMRAAREISWLAATDERKLSEINQSQRALFSEMPRRLDYVPLGQISREMDSAPTKISELRRTLELEEADCKKLEEAIVILKQKAEMMRDAISGLDK